MKPLRGRRYLASRRSRGLRRATSPQIFFVELDTVSLQQIDILVLKGAALMVLFLIRDVTAHLIEV
jgi:hypothetical protein